MNRSRLHEAFCLQLKRKEKVENHFAKAPTVACEYSRLSSLLVTRDPGDASRERRRNVS